MKLYWPRTAYHSYIYVLDYYSRAKKHAYGKKQQRRKILFLKRQLDYIRMDIPKSHRRPSMEAHLWWL